MDRVKLGRALGYGTRHAAKTLAAVAEAATTPAPRDVPRRPAGQMGSPAGRPGSAPSISTATPRSAAVRPSSTRKAGRSLWAPLATFSSALWLRVTGVFFAVIALTMLSGAWRAWTALHRVAAASGGTAVPGRRFFLFFCFGLLFVYFTVSSFVRADQRERRGR